MLVPTSTRHAEQQPHAHTVEWYHLLELTIGMLWMLAELAWVAQNQHECCNDLQVPEYVRLCLHEVAEVGLSMSSSESC